MCHGECLYVTRRSVGLRPSFVRPRPPLRLPSWTAAPRRSFLLSSISWRSFRLSRLTWCAARVATLRHCARVLATGFVPRWYGMGDCWCYDCAIVFSSLKAPTTLCSMAVPVCPVSSISPSWVGSVQEYNTEEVTMRTGCFSRSSYPTSLPNTFRALKVLGFCVVGCQRRHLSPTPR